MNRFAYFVAGAVVGFLFKENIQSTLRGAGRSALKAAMELSEDVQDLRAEAANSQRSGVQSGA